ncbi:hypothetical protein CGRA01v4_10649 [Colletotrichum graminicola]|nr:hypothetical protein CGRA01v4_10649 [Colletotrichum graminicola]
MLAVRSTLSKSFGISSPVFSRLCCFESRLAETGGLLASADGSDASTEVAFSPSFVFFFFSPPPLLAIAYSVCYR